MSQDAGGPDLASYKWEDASDIVVHAHADGDWGGCQYRVKRRSYKVSTEIQTDRGSETATNGTVTLEFSIGGFQQARGARLGPGWGSYPGHPDGRRGNPYYLEGSVEFLDAPGEWHFDPASRQLDRKSVV